MIEVILDALVLIFGILGSVLVIFKRKEGFFCYMIHSTSWGILSYIGGNTGAILVCMFFFCIDVFGYIKWTRDEKQKEGIN